MLGRVEIYHLNIYITNTFLCRFDLCLKCLKTVWIALFKKFRMKNILFVEVLKKPENVADLS